MTYGNGELHNGGWIPVSERLPDKIGMYLVTLDYEVLGNSVTMLWFHGKEIGWDLRFSDIVIAWMLLPEPYKAESENRPEFLRECFNKPINKEVEDGET